jgi:trehalose 6-phosphate phosphatase
LSHVQALLPVPGILLAGTYGIELYLPEEGEQYRLDLAAIRPVLETLKPAWEGLIAGRHGFYLEDKGYALALHARFADESEAEQVIAAAQKMVGQDPTGEEFRVLGGHKFLEIGPKFAHKGQTVAHLLDRFPWPGAILVYIGDDDKDEEAFEIIQSRGGIAVVVGDRAPQTRASFHLESPQAVRRWLSEVANGSQINNR